jgi:hypothetical protein
MRDHALIEEMIAVRSLGGLDREADGELRREMVAHGPDCPECRRLEAEYDDAAGRLAFALEPVAVRSGLEEDLVQRATAERPAAEAGRPIDRRGPSERTARLIGPLAAVAAAIALFAGGWAAGMLASDDDVDLGGSRVVAFEGQGDASLALAYRPGEDGVFVLGSGLDPQPRGIVYEFWTFRGDTPVRGGCFRPSPDGSVFAFLDARVAETTRLLAVTVESASCPAAPTTQPVFVAELA